MRPLLRPGLKILRRDIHTLQLGLDWPGLTVLRETPALRAVLEAIDGFRDAAGVILAATAAGPSHEECEEALVLLVDSGAVVDNALRRPTHLSESTESALWLLAGPGRSVADVVEARARCVVWIDGEGVVAEAARSLLTTAQVTVCTDPAKATVVLAASDREPSRDQADTLMHAGLPHLWCYVRDLVGVVGPFVLPGTSACLRCVDAAHTDIDPAWPTLLRSTTVRPLRVPPCDSLLATLVAAWAAQDVTLWASELRPQTCDRVIEIPQGWGPVEAAHYELHPLCGCGWPLWQDTMGA
ncbi:MAG TPA: hypothetical protein VES21_08995 [Nocardioidaceae bacterium]|nr:hypothetical protein [Nocardioidaceae bacterium]